MQGAGPGGLDRGGLRRRRGERPPLKVLVPRAELLERPGDAAVGSVRLGQPVRATGRERHGWREIVTDTGEAGWVRATTLEQA